MWLTVFTSQVQQVTSTSTKNQYVTRLVAVVVCILAMMMMMVCDVLTTPQGRTPPPPPPPRATAGTAHSHSAHSRDAGASLRHSLKGGRQTHVLTLAARVGTSSPPSLCRFATQGLLP